MHFVSSAWNKIVCGFALLCLAGCGAPSFLVTPVSSNHTLKEEAVEEGKGFNHDKIAIIEVEGMLANVRSGGFLQASENPLSIFTQELEKAEQDDDVKAIVLRVNSPGGTVTAADTMYEMLKRFKEKTHKPVIASTQEVTASGAYYVCCAADKIVASPTSIVGSIGVIFSNFDLADGLAKIGVAEPGDSYRHAQGDGLAVQARDAAGKIGDGGDGQRVFSPIYSGREAEPPERERDASRAAGE